MGLFDNVNKLKDQALAQKKQAALDTLVTKAAEVGVKIRNADIEMGGEAVVVKGNVASEEDRQKLLPLINGFSTMMNIKVRESLTVDNPAPRGMDEPKEQVVIPTQEEVTADEQTYTVVKGDSLWAIAEKYYGDGTKHPIISEHNNKEHIHPGDVLTIPDLKSHIGGEKLQVMLTVLGHDPKGIDGKVGNNTITALKAFQSANGIEANGKVDGATKSALRQSFSNHTGNLGGKALQILLRDAGHSPGAIDGIVGKGTTKAVIAFQTAKGLDANGQVNADTISQLIGNYA
ncbi:MAG: LysM peptidoglycan-binding domain-containing protein [Aureispira sp.]|nr:LysM peptidoglycan-binding domain-containing protein [Aureispira sp.]